MNLDSLIFAPNDSLKIKNKKLNETHAAELDTNLEFNWIFSQLWLLIYIYIYIILYIDFKVPENRVII